jgi:chorismate synthase
MVQGREEVTSYSIRPLRTLEDYQQCVRLQEEVWGQGFSERAPLSLLKVSQRLGGVVAGAFAADGFLLGFVFGLTGLEEGRPVHWSDMLAVRPGLRDSGIGTQLKSFQRAECMARGVRRMYWTFDPLESRNAYLNFGKLGATSHEYVRDMYGHSDSPLHLEIGTDRLVVTWDLDSPRVIERLSHRYRPLRAEDVEGVPAAFEVVRKEKVPLPGESRLDAGAQKDASNSPVAGGMLVPIPADVQQLKGRSKSGAVAWRKATRAAFLHSLQRGLTVRDFVPGEELSHYLLVPELASTG